jgi:hypothetical protein
MNGIGTLRWRPKEPRLVGHLQVSNSQAGDLFRFRVGGILGQPVSFGKKAYGSKVTTCLSQTTALQVGLVGHDSTSTGEPLPLPHPRVSRNGPPRVLGMPAEPLLGLSLPHIHRTPSLPRVSIV